MILGNDLNLHVPRPRRMRGLAAVATPKVAPAILPKVPMPAAAA